jgi:hypothetical protein
MVAIADRDCVDGDLLERVPFGFAEASLEETGLDVLDRVPADLQVLGDILDGPVPGQIPDVAFESAGVVLLGIREAQLSLPDAATGKAQDGRHLKVE